MGKTNQNIIQQLERLDFQFENTDVSSIYFISDLEKKKDLSPKIVLDLDRAKIFKADAVYFRFFDGGRLPQPQIYIYDNSDSTKTDSEIAEIHRAIWSASEIPMFIVLNKSKVKIYDGRQPITIKDGKLTTKPIDEIDFNNLAKCNEIVERYRAQKFDNGNFWESETAQRHFLNSETAYKKLIDGLRSLRSYFKAHCRLSSDLSDHLLILSILIKYLEENGKEDDGDNLAGKFFFEKTGYSSFEDIIRENKIITLFDELAKHFNGGLFKLTAAQKEELKDADISVLSNFLEGKLKENQFVIWQEYSFKYIPVELISNFYEEFLPKLKKAGKEKETKADTGAVYTPGFLVNFLVDECLPLTRNELNENVKLADISCGSGIFISTCYKRLVQRWRIRNAQDGKLADTNPEILKAILLQNIFGVDIDKNAVELTIFSLNLTLCAMLTPRQIWTQLQFDDLKANGNIVENDFFKHLIENKPSGFDLIIGNPPFKALNQKEYKESADILKEKGMPFLCKIPDNQLSLMFLDKAMDLLKDNGILCLIMPSGPMLYNNTIEFRSRFFDCYNIPQIIDFTFLQNTLFSGANVSPSVVALFAQKQKPNDEDILHVTVRRTKANKERNYFEIDHYDFHDVPKSVARTNDFVWKCNLIGGGRIYHLVQKLKDGYCTLGDYLSYKKANNQWDFGQGYILGIQNRKFKAEYITGKLSVIDKKFNENGIQGTEIQLSEYFKDKSNEVFFQPPHLLIKKTIGKKAIPVEFRDDYLTFRNEVIGIHAPINEKSELFKLANTFQNDNQLFRFFIAATSARSGVSRSIYSCLAEDIYNLPFLEGNFNLSFSESIQVSDVVDFYIDFFGFGENAIISQRLDGVEDPEVKKVFQAFSDIYCMALNSIYQEGDKKYALSKIYEGVAFFACEYAFTGENSELRTIHSEADFDALIDQWNGRNALIKRVVRFYGNNTIILVKPKQLRYWLKSNALRDADETMEESFTQNLLQ